MTAQHSSPLNMLRRLLDCLTPPHGRIRTGGCLAEETQPRIGISAVDWKGVTRLIFSIVRTALIGLRRDRGALALSFILPIVFL